VEHTTVAVEPAAADAVPTVLVPSAGLQLDAVERALIQFALDANDANRTRAARFLGLSRSALLYRMQKHHLVSKAAWVPDLREPL
jgi:DNA-binding NtrC family response regulator